MANQPNQEHLAILQKGVEAWNQWRQENPDIEADLKGANLKYQYLPAINLDNAMLKGVDFEAAVLCGAYLRNANLQDAHLYRTDFCDANLMGACLKGADLVRAKFIEANLQNTDLRWVKLSEANLRGADITGSAVYGISAWEVTLDDIKQLSLSIARDGSPTLAGDGDEVPAITVDLLEIAQLVHLLQDYKKLQYVLNSVMDRGVLLLGRFKNGGLDLLRSIAEQLRKQNYLPMIFEFKRPDTADYTETIITLAGISKFVIVELSGRSVPQELQATVPFFEIPFVPISYDQGDVYTTLSDFTKYPWFLHPVTFSSEDELLAKLDSEIIKPAEEKAKEQKTRKSKNSLDSSTTGELKEITENTMNKLQFKTFRESVLHARPLTEEDYEQKNGMLKTSEGSVTFQSGDYLVKVVEKGEEKGERVIAQQDFSKIYERVSEPDTKGFAAYRNNEKCEACRRSEPFIVKHASGYEMKGNSGDYVVRFGDEVRVFACDSFERIYERTVEEKK